MSGSGPGPLRREITVADRPVMLTVDPGVVAAVAAHAAARAHGVARVAPSARRAARRVVAASLSKTKQTLTRQPTNASMVAVDAAAVEVDDSLDPVAVGVRIVASTRQPVVTVAQAVLDAVTKDLDRLVGIASSVDVVVLAIDD